MAINTPSIQSLSAGLDASSLRELGGTLRALDKLNQELAQVLNFTSPWVKPPLLENGWVDFSSTRFLRYKLERCIGDTLIVLMEGRIRAGTVGATTPVFHLRDGLWPEQDLTIVTNSNGAHGNITISSTTGAVAVGVGNNASVDMNFFFIPKQGG